MRVGLVLGAGGIAGYAFHVATLAAIESRLGWRANDAEIIVGTSAGSGVAAMARADVGAVDLYKYLLGEEPSARGRAQMDTIERTDSPFRQKTGGVLPIPAAPQRAMQLLARPWRWPQLALQPNQIASAVLPEGTVDTYALGSAARAFYPDQPWPDRTTWICATLLKTGERVVLGRDWHPPIHMAKAVQASSAVPGYFSPVEVDAGGTDDGRYVDGGVYSPTNADVLAHGSRQIDLAIVLSPMTATTEAAEWLRSSLRGRAAMKQLPRRAHGEVLRREIAQLRAADIPVVTFQPTVDVMRQATSGGGGLDPSIRKPVAVAAYRAAAARLEDPEIAERLSTLGAAA